MIKLRSLFYLMVGSVVFCSLLRGAEGEAIEPLEPSAIPEEGVHLYFPGEWARYVDREVSVVVNGRTVCAGRLSRALVEEAELMGAAMAGVFEVSERYFMEITLEGEGRVYYGVILDGESDGFCTLYLLTDEERELGPVAHPRFTETLSLE